MKLPAHGGADLTYCSNIHPGEQWSETRENLERYVVEVKQRVCPDGPFGVGLRLSAEAADALARPAELEAFAGWLREQDLYVFTLNGFPYGPFHGQPVKEAVYRPDWSEPERGRYTRMLAEIARGLWQPERGEVMSISTVPGCFADRAVGDVPARMRAALVEQVGALWEIREAGGPEIVLALEPEPCCFLETVEETVAYFRDHLHGRSAVEALCRATGLGIGEAEEVLRRHLGVCLDTCHAAVEYEDPRAVFGELDAAGIRVGKVQVTTGLRLAVVDDETVRAVEHFADDVYLHQVVVRRGEQLVRHVDLPHAIAEYRSGLLADEWRVHFHVPVFLRDLDPFENTQAWLEDALGVLARDERPAALELETYTWDVLPSRYRDVPVVEAIVRELQWLEDRWRA